MGLTQKYLHILTADASRLAAVGTTSGWIAPAAVFTAISGLGPYPDGGDPNDTLAVSACNGAPQGGMVYRNSETEPYIAVNPDNPDNMIAAWHQDR